MPEIIDAGNIVTKNASGDYLLMQRGAAIKRITKTDIFREYDVLQYGCVCNGTTDDTAAFQALINLVVAAGGGTIRLPGSKMLIAGALQDTGNGNAQILFPLVLLTVPTVVINIVGHRPPPTQFFTSSVPPNAGYSTIKSTLSGGTGTAAVFGGTTTSTFIGLQTNIVVNMRDIIGEAAPNPSLTFFNFKYFQGFDYWENILIHCGSVQLNAVVQPTNSNAYGWKVPAVNHTCFNYMKNVMVHHYYFGGRLSECNTAIGLRFYGCYKPLAIPFAHHASIIVDYDSYWCPYGIVALGNDGSPGADNIGRVRILRAGHELADVGQGAAAWQVAVNQIDDPSNYLKGDMVYQCVQGGVGENNSLFAKNGGTKFLTTPIGGIKPLGFTPASSTDNTYPNGTTAYDDNFLWFRTSTGTWKKIALAAF